MKNETKRKPKSTIFLIALYVHHHLGHHEFTSRMLHNAGDAAQEYYESLIPQEVLDKKLQILTKYGFTQTQWEQILEQSSEFYFVPPPGASEANQEIYDLMQTQTIINRTPFYSNYTSQLIKQAINKGYFEYVQNQKRPYTYRITPRYLRALYGTEN